MAWDDRLREAAYTPPEAPGVVGPPQRLPFQFQDVSRSTEKGGSPWTFPDFPGAFVQDTGVGARVYPLRVFISGPDYDLDATAFYDALELSGVGTLEHPVYGVKRVVPLGRFRRRDNLVTGANQAIIDVEFWETIEGLTFPATAADATAEVAAQVEDFATVTGPGQFNADLDISTGSESINAQTSTTNAVNATVDALGALAETDQDIFSLFDALALDILNNIETLIGDPLELATRCVELVRLPGRVERSIAAKFDGYGVLLDTLTANIPGVTNDNEAANTYAIDNLFALAGVAAMSEQPIDATVRSKPDALLVAVTLAARLDQVVTWGDDSREALDLVDTGEAYQSAYAAAVTSVSNAVALSFTLLQERAITLTRPRTIIDLAYELFGAVDEHLDDLINNNALTGAEILELPAGRTVVYYVDPAA